MGRKKKKRVVVLIIMSILFLWILWGNRTVELNTITLSSAELPTAFSGYKIAQISDIHNAQFGNDNMKPGLEAIIMTWRRH